MSHRWSTELEDSLSAQLMTFSKFCSEIPDQICNRTFEVLKGTTRTLHFLHENGYAHNMDCEFRLIAPSHGQLRITFTEFDLEQR